jgi:hypothetical protein
MAAVVMPAVAIGAVAMRVVVIGAAVAATGAAVAATAAAIGEPFARRQDSSANPDPCRRHSRPAQVGIAFG